jgi:eukaryotic-like serine/threonine-protein kinase
VRRSETTISCRAFALTALLIAVCALRAVAGDRPQPPGLPLAQWWSVKLDGPVSAGPASDGSRIYIALASGHLTALEASGGREIWRQTRNVTAALAADADLLFVASGDAVEALQGATGKTAWTLPRMTPVAPLLAQAGWLFITTETEVIAVHAATGEVAWRHAAGGVKLSPALDGDRVYSGADDGRVLALNLKDGSVAWEQFMPEGVTAIAGHGGRVYAGAGNKRLYCLDAKKGEAKWNFSLGALAVGRIVADDDRVYVASLNNVVWALDRQSGNQRWKLGLPQRPSFGVEVSGHVVFVPTARSTDLPLVYDHDGRLSGSLALPGQVPPALVPSIKDTPQGTVVYAVTGTLANEWNLAKYARAGEANLIPLAALDAMPGVPYLIDPVLAPIGAVLGALILGDPRLMPLSDADWPIVLRDPPLVPLTTLPGVQLRPLSPVPPVRRAERGPGG